MAAAMAQEEGKLLAPSITVSGQGEVKGQPDMAQISVGVVTEAKSAAEAMEANNTAMHQLMASLKQEGIAEKDIQTANFSVNPQYRQDELQRQARIVGYQVENLVQINVRDLSKLGGLLEKLVQSGANRMHGINFQFSDRKEILNRARRDALADARQAAQIYAEAAGVHLGDVLLIREQSAAVPVAYRGVAMEAMAARAPVPIAPGEQTVSINVSVTYALAATK
jgi:uncharacterized protein YggE